MYYIGPTQGTGHLTGGALRYTASKGYIYKYILSIYMNVYLYVKIYLRVYMNIYYICVYIYVLNLAHPGNRAAHRRSTQAHSFNKTIRIYIDDMICTIIVQFRHDQY